DLIVTGVQTCALPISLDVMGSVGAYHGEAGFAEALKSRLGHPAVRRLGPVSHERMAGVLADLDVMVVPSIWIENAPFIIREAFRSEERRVGKECRILR